MTPVIRRPSGVRRIHIAAAPQPAPALAIPKVEPGWLESLADEVRGEFRQFGAVYRDDNLIGRKRERRIA